MTFFERSLSLFVIVLAVMPMLFISYKLMPRIKVHPYSLEAVFLYSFLMFYLSDLIFCTFEYNGEFLISGIKFKFDAGSLVALAVYYGASAFLIVLGLSAGGRARDEKISSNIQIVIHNFSHPLPFAVALLLLCVSIAWLLWKISVFGFQGYFQNMAVRALLFADSTMQNAFVSASISIYALIVSCRYAASLSWAKLGFESLPLLLVIGLAGARAPLVEFLFIFLFIGNYYARRYRLRPKSVVFAVLGVVALAQLAMATRIHADTEVSGLVEKVFATEQVPQSENGLNIVVSGYKEPTLLLGTVSFVPRGVFDAVGLSKGYGANAIYTERFVSYRWTEQNSQISLGGLNEILLNTNIYMAALLAAVFSLLIKGLGDALAERGVMVMLMPALSWSVFQFMRGDLYHTVNKFFTFFAAFILFLMIVGLVKMLKKAYGK